MTLVQLEYIVALDKYLHFGEAAEHCFVTQPTLSMQIQKLEETLGVKLFERSKNKVTPTKIGERVIAQAKEVLNEARKIKALIGEEQGDIKGSVKIGIIPTIAPYLVPLFAPDVASRHAALELSFSELLTDELLEAVAEGRLDLGIVAGPVNNTRVSEVPLYNEPFLVYASMRHPFFSLQSVDSGELTTNGLWLLYEGHCFREQAMKICGSQSAGKTPFRYESGSLEGLKKLVDRQGGYTLLPELATVDFSQADKTKLRPFKEPAPSRQVTLVASKSFTRTKVMQAIFESILQSLPPLIKTQRQLRTVTVA